MKSDCHSSFGRSASKRFQDVRGRFLGSCFVSPACLSLRWIVDYVVVGVLLVVGVVVWILRLRSGLVF